MPVVFLRTHRPGRVTGPIFRFPVEGVKRAADKKMPAQTIKTTRWPAAVPASSSDEEEGPKGTG
jgi:hypothetical protein